MRSEKGSELTHPEVDTNFKNLRNAINAVNARFASVFNAAGGLLDGTVTTAAIANRSVTAPKLALNALAPITVGGTGDAMTGGLSPAATLVNGLRIGVRVEFNNTSTVTLDLDSTGPKAVVKNAGDPLVSGDLVAGMVVDLVYGSTNDRWVVVSPTIPPPPLETQFITYESSLLAVPASGGLLTFTHGLVDADDNALMPDLMQLWMVRTAAGSEVFDDGWTIAQSERIPTEIVWSGRRGSDHDQFRPVFRSRVSATNVVVWALYPHGLSIIRSSSPGGDSSWGQSVSPSDYQLKLYAMVLNPNFEP